MKNRPETKGSANAASSNTRSDFALARRDLLGASRLNAWDSVVSV